MNNSLSELDAMELDEAIRGRRSIRAYTSQPVPLELIRDIIEAGTFTIGQMGSSGGSQC